MEATVLTVARKALSDLAAWTPPWPHLRLLTPAHSTPATLPSLLILTNHTPASGALHLLLSASKAFPPDRAPCSQTGPLPSSVQVSLCQGTLNNTAQDIFLYPFPVSLFPP